jgi:hypothetical protein
MTSKVVEAPRQEGLSATRATMRMLFEAVRALDIREYEALEPGPALDEFSRRMRTMLGQTIEVAAGLESRGAEAGASAGEPAQHVANVAFMTRIELRQRLSPLEAPLGEDGWERVCACAAAIRCITTSLAALDQALCAAEGLPRVIELGAELESSLRVRRLYRKLWRLVDAAGDVGPTDVRARLRGAGTLLAMVVGRNEYSRLRGPDRLQMKTLQRRMLEWMAHPGAEPRLGVRIWEDFAGFARMLRQVSLRQELVQHDQELLAQLGPALTALPPHAAVPPELLAKLERLEGLDDALDALLEDAAPSATRVLHEVLRLQPRLGPHDSTPRVPSSAALSEAL